MDEKLRDGGQYLELAQRLLPCYTTAKECSMEPDLTREEILRFHSKYQKKSDGECWEFQSVDFSIRRPEISRKSYAPYRISWILANNSRIPPGKMICHHCDNPPCVNPSHLYLGTGFENNRDTVRRGRARRATGESCSWSKLTGEQVLEIKSSSVRQVDLAKKYGVSQSHISRIRSGDRNLWKELGTDLNLPHLR